MVKGQVLCVGYLTVRFCHFVSVSIFVII